MKNKFQNVDFKNIDDFLEYLPADQLQIVEALRSLIFQCIPDCEEKLSYNVPFYKRYKSICFIWPSAIPWGKITRDGVRLGFNQGYLFDDNDFLMKGERKQIFCRDFLSLIDLNRDLVKSFLFEASIIDSRFSKKKILEKPARSGF